jgi:hypothetical protein
MAMTPIIFATTPVAKKPLSATGKIVQSLSAAGDCDDVFYDQARKRIYASGGEGAISVFEQQDADHYTESARDQHGEGSTDEFFLSRSGSAIFGSAPPGVAVGSD